MGFLKWWGRRGFTRQPESPNVHISGFRPSKTPTKFNERTPRERKKNENCGGRRGNKERNFGWSGVGLSGGGLSGGGGFTARGSSGRVHRQWGAGFGVSGSVQVFGDENRNRTKTKMKREMSKNKKNVKKSKKTKQKKKQEREKEETEQTPSVRLRPINFDLGQFRLRPISTSANFDFGQFDFGQLAEVELSEVELAEVEHPRVHGPQPLPPLVAGCLHVSHQSIVSRLSKPR